MCSGPFTLASWQAGGEVLIERNDAYWNTDAAPLVPSITFIPVSDDAALNAGLTTGDVSGTYASGLTIVEQLATSEDVTLTAGPSLDTEVLAVARAEGPLADVRVRQALSLALDRQAYIDAIYFGNAAIPRSTASPSTWNVDAAELDPILGNPAGFQPDVEKAKQLIADAGAEGQNIVLATPAGAARGDVIASLLGEAAQQIGLTVEQKTIPRDLYNGLFFNPAARAEIDLFISFLGSTIKDPGPFLSSIALDGAPYNFTGYSDDQVTGLLTQARETEDPSERALLEAQADALITESLPQIPLAHPYNMLYLDSGLTGPPASTAYLSGAWANLVGAK